MLSKITAGDRYNVRTIKNMKRNSMPLWFQKFAVSSHCIKK